MIDRLIQRGQIYCVDFGSQIGSEQSGIRPALVIQNNIGNRYSPTAIVTPITSRPKRLSMPTHILLSNCPGLPVQSMAMLEQIRTVDKIRLQAYIGTVDDRTMLMIDKALEISIGICRTHTFPNEIILCLCPVCAAQFYNSNKYRIHRTNLNQITKELCAYCQVRYGYDYTINSRNEVATK